MDTLNIMSAIQLGIHIPVTIQTVTPLHIGGNDVLSPLADYWMDEQRNIHLVSGELLAGAVYESGKINDFIRSVEQVVTEKKGRMLTDFVKYTLRKDMDAFSAKAFWKSYGIENPIEIDCCIQTDGLPYIPGSSLKGALRTALLQNWLGSNSGESNRALDDFLTVLKVFAKRDDLKKSKQADEIEKVFCEKIEEKLFGSLKDNDRLAASYLRINDTGTAMPEQIAVYQLERYNLLTGDRGTIPVLKQCISRRSLFNTAVHIDYYSCREKKFHRLFRDIETKEQLFAMLNRTTLQVLSYELGLMENDEVYAGKLRSYEDFMAALKEEIEQSGNRKAWLRLGYGKMQFYQTIALNLFARLGKDEENPDWVQYLCYCNKMSDDLAAVYPSTRVLTGSGQEPLGWVQLS